MSGGTMEYLYSKIADAKFIVNSPLRRAFYNHLQLVSEACRAIEWNDSGDGADNEDDAIRLCLREDASLKEAIEMARDAKKALENEMALAMKKYKDD